MYLRGGCLCRAYRRSAKTVTTFHNVRNLNKMAVFLKDDFFDYAIFYVKGSRVAVWNRQKGLLIS